MFLWFCCRQALEDSEFGVSLRAARYERIAEMYQYIETKRVRKFKEGEYTREETTFQYGEFPWSIPSI